MRECIWKINELRKGNEKRNELIWLKEILIDMKEIEWIDLNIEFVYFLICGFD